MLLHASGDEPLFTCRLTISQATQALGTAGVKGEELVAAGATYMRERPLITLGLALTAGFVLSRLLSAR
jgi:ElaB/YqjD/DUF883 family membrane-anchored ribosome-binding protein